METIPVISAQSYLRRMEVYLRSDNKHVVLGNHILGSRLRKVTRCKEKPQAICLNANLYLKTFNFYVLFAIRFGQSPLFRTTLGSA